MPGVIHEQLGGKRIAVTGSTGFLGTALVERLLRSVPDCSLVLLVRRDFVSRYQQTLLGPLWHLIQPVLTALLFALIFSRVANIPTDGIPAPLFYLCGLLGWNYFSQNITVAGATFVNNQALIGKVWFPRLVMPLAVVASNLVAFALQCVPFLAFFLYYRFFALGAGSVELSARALLLPLPVLHIAALSLGVCLWVAATTAKFRDLIHLNAFIVQLWMFATPLVYPLSSVPPRLAWLGWVNPMAAPTEAIRWCLLGRGTLAPMSVACSVAMTLLLLVTGLVAFQNAARSAVDTV